MDHRRLSKRVPVLLIVLVLAAMLGACGSSQETMPPATGSILSGSTPTAGLKICVRCHTRQTADWLTTGHANLEPAGDLFSYGVPTISQISGCTNNCHDPLGDSNNLTAGTTGAAGIKRPVIGCESCHGPGSLHANDGGMGPISLISNTTGSVWGGTISVSGQFMMCTSCHELLNSAGTSTAVATHDSSGPQSPKGSQYIITDTHFAVALSGSGPIAGYAMDYASPTVCTECHNPHKNAEIERQWAASAKGELAASGPWARNWSRSPTCQRCHTTTGFAAHADALAAGNTTRAHDILYGTLASYPVPSAATWKPEMLLCKGCHTDKKGALRNPGAYTADYSYSFYVTPPTVATIYSVASHAYPDLSGSNQCMPCHTGRQNGDSIKNMNRGVVTAVTFTNRSLFDGHHYQAGAVMYGAAGYNYTGRDYSNPPQYRHDQIGSASDAPNTGTNGPCVGCHMLGPNGTTNHLFPHPSTTTSVVSGITRTTITNIPSGACSTCHGPDQVAFLKLVSQAKNDFTDAQGALQYLLEQRGYYKRGSSYYKLRDNTGTVNVTSGNSTITGLATSWTTTFTTSGTKVADGDYFRVDSDGVYSRITATAGSPAFADGLLTLGTSTVALTPYAGATANGVEYTIIGGSTNDRIVDWLTKAGTGFVPAPVTDTDTTGNTTGKNNIGAAFNLNLFGNALEPAAYVHNRHYAKKLIYDSIDWMDDNVLNYSTGTTLNTICTGGTPPAWCAGAMSYLLPNGVIGNGVAYERP